ncbi:MAG: chemotaxis protein CheW [Thermoanaerobaculales bacterium]|jgi:chemotaxis signal transduction protein|nr:chemotaxis protein CheW [Thermoanaerobaculales bacterium]
MGSGTDQADAGIQCLMVRSGGYRCGIPVAAAKQVATARRLDLVPGSDARLLGLAQIGGEPVAVVDLHALLDPEGAPGGSHELTVVIRRGDGTSAIGLAVDEAFGVALISGVVRRHEADSEVVGGRSEHNGRSVFILDPTILIAERDSHEKGAPNAG